jgi:tetratricopeptide (TPR) repeat protein
MELAAKGLEDENPLVRQAAVSALQGMPAQVIVGLLSTRMNDSSLAVRIEIGLLLASVVNEIPADLQADAGRVIDEYRTTLEQGLDSPANLASLATLSIYLGDIGPVEALYLQALEIEPAYIPAMVNLADLYRSQGKEEAAGLLLSRAVEIAPDSSMAQHALGLHFVRLKQYNNALQYLQEAAGLPDSQPRYNLVYAVALDSQGQVDLSIQSLMNAVEQWPNQYELLFTLVSYLDRQGRLSEAGGYISQLSRIAPASPQVQNLVTRFQLISQ